MCRLKRNLFLRYLFNHEPIYAEEIVKGALLFPSNYEQYDSLPDLIDRIEDHIHTYLDLPVNIRGFAAWYIILSWIYDKSIRGRWWALKSWRSWD